jgi:threonylcarbamoyladenosine tRNA methylthiotransferase MtaB
METRTSDPRSSQIPTAAILTLGCKLNIADSEAMARELRQAGWRVTDRLGPADAVIVNSCSVTSTADQKSRHLLHRARRLLPDATIAFTGCMVKTAPAQQIEALNADLVAPRTEQQQLARQLIDLRPAPLIREQQRALKTRAFIAAQEGCNDVCAFCIIPRTRGRERSKSIQAVVSEARQREAEGAQEIVITGTQLGAYGRDGIGANPARLLAALLDGTGVPRIRMSSLQPQDLTTELLQLWQEPRLCRHFHLALQSGSESVLRRMRRRYSKVQYRDAVARLRQAVPGVAITTDLIVGFPGETEAEFEESYAFCREMAFAAIHVFPYSPRAGTLAARLPDLVSEPAKKQRVQCLIELAGRLSTDYRARMLGSEAEVLWEAQDSGGVWEGLTDTYVRVQARCQDDLNNRLRAVRITELRENGLWGEIAEL